MQSRLTIPGLLLTSFILILASCYSGQKDTKDSKDTKANERGNVSMPTTGCVQGACDNGDGSFAYPSGDKYAGTFKNGLREGKGALDYGSGDRYVGEFTADKRTGNGTYTFANGDVYVGQFKDGERAGKGVYTFKDGAIFDGDFQNDGRSGTGTLKVGTSVRNCSLQDRKILCEPEKAATPASADTKDTDKK